MSDDTLVEKIAREAVEQHGADALPILRERAEAADGAADTLAADTWRRIVEAAERMLRDRQSEDV